MQSLLRPVERGGVKRRRSLNDQCSTVWQFTGDDCGLPSPFWLVLQCQHNFRSRKYSMKPWRTPKCLRHHYPNARPQPYEAAPTTYSRASLCSVRQHYHLCLPTTAVMATSHFETLAKELIANVACYTDASSVLSLSLTSKRLRSASYDSLVFRELLINSQRCQWVESYLDVDAIAARAGNDVETWARYALADQKAWNLSQQGESPLGSPKDDFLHYVPELLVLKHPFVKDLWWKHLLREPFDGPPNQLFCLAVASMATANDEPPFFKREDPSSDRESARAFLWAFRTIALDIRASLKKRLAAWPYNNAANVPHITTPNIYQIPLHPLSHRYTLPSPFPQHPAKLLRLHTVWDPTFGNWDTWYHLHNYEAFKSPTYLTEGTWCGYYTYLGPQAGQLDPPMTEIRFQLQTLPQRDVERIGIVATNCVDGIARFDLLGSLIRVEDGIKLKARMNYLRRQPWDWDCRLTPFGIVGYWGTSGQDGLSRQGLVWLWKKEWTETSQ